MNIIVGKQENLSKIVKALFVCWREAHDSCLYELKVQ